MSAVQIERLSLPLDLGRCIKIHPPQFPHSPAPRLIRRVGVFTAFLGDAYKAAPSRPMGSAGPLPRNRRYAGALYQKSIHVRRRNNHLPLSVIPTRPADCRANENESPPAEGYCGPKSRATALIRSDIAGPAPRQIVILCLL